MFYRLHIWLFTLLLLTSVSAFADVNQLKAKLETLTEHALVDQLKSLDPLANYKERKAIKTLAKTGREEQIREYIVSFWSNRDNEDPFLAWQQYSAEVEKVQEYFGTRLYKGYETDRGRVYLQYGPPNNISGAIHDPAALPHQVWHYYTLGNQRNIIFVFYNPFIAGNMYELLHSSAFGEIQNPRWREQLYGRMGRGRYSANPAGSRDSW